ncbi:MAG: FxsA family protein [Alphaproteobacteria bacterium]
MPLLILLIILAIPLGELWLLIAVGGVIGATWTVLACIATAALGLALVRRQGVGLLMAARQRYASGQPPVMEALEGAALVVAGLFLMFPGFASDALGFMLLVPPLRAGLVRLLLGRLVVRQSRPRQDRPRQSRPRQAEIIEGDWRVEEDRPPPDDRPGKP